MRAVLDVVIPLLIIVACWCFGALWVTAFYVALLALAVAVIWRGYYSYTDRRDPVELDCGFSDTVYGQPEPAPLTVINCRKLRAVWPNDAGGIE